MMTLAASEQCHGERVEVAPATRRWYCHLDKEEPLGNASSAISPAKESNTM